MKGIIVPSKERAADIFIPLDNIAWVEVFNEETRIYLRQPVSTPPLYLVTALYMSQVLDRIAALG